MCDKKCSECIYSVSSECDICQIVTKVEYINPFSGKNIKVRTLGKRSVLNSNNDCIHFIKK